MSNGRQIGTIVGSLVAAYFTAGTSYAAFAVAAGGAVGGAVGGAMDGPNRVEGPRLDDLKVSTSNYGAGLPVLYGTERIAGNVIWSTDKIELATTHNSSGGKGGDSTSTTSYAYYVHMSIALCETPSDGSAVGILKIFRDGKLIWDASSGIPIGAALITATNLFATLELFQGAEDQLPDPIEEQYVGAGMAPAYRGTVRVRMLAIECLGGRVPQFSFVLSNSFTSAPEVYQGVPLTVRSQFLYLSRLSEVSTLFAMRAYNYNGDPLVDKPAQIWKAGPTGGGVLGTFLGVNWGTGVTVPGEADIDCVCVREYDPVSGLDIGRNTFYGGDGNAIQSFYPGTDAPAIGANGGSFAKRGNRLLLACDTSYALVLLYDFERSEQLARVTIANVVKVVLSDSYAWTFINGNTIQVRAQDPYLTLIASASMPGAVLGQHINFCYGPNDAIWLCAHDTNQVHIYSVALVSGSLVFTHARSYTPFDGSIPYPMMDPFTYDGRTLFCWTANAAGGGAGSTVRMSFIAFDQLTSVEQKVSDIIADQCDRAGLVSYDVSGIPDTDTVTGYKLENPASARANMEPLFAAFQIFCVDEDGVLKFKKYSAITSVASVAYDELGQSEGDQPGDMMPLTRTQSSDLPRSLTVKYLDPDFDYQPASETEQRMVTAATLDQSVSLAMAIRSSQAKTAARLGLFAAWRGQNTRNAVVSRKFAFVTPGDGVTIEYPRGTFQMWRVTSANDTGAVIEWSLEPGDAALYTQTAQGAKGFAGQVLQALPATTRAQVLDIPLLRDIDNNAGLYVAFDSLDGTEAAAELFVGPDDTALASRGTVEASAPIGSAEAALAAAPSSGLVDETNSFIVNLGGDTFNSCTRDVLLSGGGEYWAYGVPGRWEIGASAVGTNLGSGRWTLTRHLRGQFGTERNMGNHLSGDTFVLLRVAGLLHPSLTNGDIGQPLRYRAVSKGRSFDSTTSQSYTSTGEGLMPLSPVNLRRSATNDLSVDRRSRLAMNNATGILPLGETTEAYSWAFYSSGSFIALLATVLTTTSTVTAAQMTAAGITPTAPLYVKVRQISDSVGPGHELQATA